MYNEPPLSSDNSRLPARAGWFRSEKTLLMGVLNVTPDSFWDGGRFPSADAAVDRALRMIDEGADIIDVGGESSRPGAAPTPQAEEEARVLPVVEALARRADTPISVDTYKPETARRCLNAGAAIVNDIRGMTDPAMQAAAAEAGASVILMHMRGEPRTMQQDTAYGDVVAEIRQFLLRQAAAAHAAGVAEIAVDPGIGFGKTARQNFEILARLRELATPDYPLAVGPSRKSFLGSLASRLPVEERLEGTLAAAAAAALNGAKIVRVHDVKPCRRVLETVDAIRGASNGR